MSSHSKRPIRKKTKKRRPYYGRIIATLLIFGLIVYFVVKLGISLFLDQHTSYLVDYGSLDIKKDYQAVVVRNELLVSTSYKGLVTYFANEGESVEKGQQIAEIFNDGSDLPEVADETEKEQVQKKIEFDYNSLESDIMNLKNKIIAAIDKSDFEAIPALKESLILKLETREKLEGENKFLSNRTTSQSKATVGGNGLKEGEKGIINAPADGYITYRMDGYEDYLTIDNIYNINYDEIGENQSTSLYSQAINGDDTPLFKIIDQSSIYLLVPIETSEAETYKSMNAIEVKLGDQLLEGQIYDVFSGNDQDWVAVKLAKVLPVLMETRKVSISLIKENYQGLKINVDSIVNRDNQLGVFEVDEENRLQFVPIKVLGYDEDYAIIMSNQFYDEKEGLVRTLKVNQEVVRDAKAFKEGDQFK